MSLQINGQTQVSQLPPGDAVNGTVLRSTNAPTQNGVVDHAPSQQATPQGGPIDGGRECTTNTTPGWEEIEAMAEQRAMRDPEYAKKKALLESLGDFENRFLHMDTLVGWANDEAITLTDILALVNDVNANPEARALAKFLNDNRDVWSLLAKGDNKVGVHDVREFMANLKSEVNGKKETARTEVRSELGLDAAGKPAGGQGASGQSASEQTSTEPGAAPITLSTKPGVEGALENLGNVADSLQAQMLELAKKAAEDPAKAVQYQQQIAQLQNQYQAITNMMNQLTQMISNLSKMWSDVAMNSIRNVK